MIQISGKSIKIYLEDKLLTLSTSKWLVCFRPLIDQRHFSKAWL